MTNVSERSTRRWLIAMFLIALAIRVIYVITVGNGVHWWPDEAEYHEIATNLLQGRGYSSSFHVTSHVPSPTAYRAPGLPMLLAFVYRFAGPNLIAARLLQAVLGAAMVPLGFMIARELGYSRRVGLVACAAIGSYPYYVFCAGTVYPVVLSTTTLGLATLALLKSRCNSAFGWEAIGGILVGLTVLTFGHALAAIPFVALWLVLNKRAGYRKGWMAATVFLAVCGLSLAPWVLRNAVVMGRPGLSTAFEYNLCMGNAPGVRWNSGGGIYLMESPNLKKRVAGLTEGDAARLYYRVGVNEIRANPVRFVMLSLGKAINFWRFYPRFVTRPVSIFDKLVGLLTYGPALVLTLLLLIAERSRFRTLFLLISYPFGAMIVAGITVSIDRYRLPFDLYLIIFASASVVMWFDRSRKSRLDRIAGVVSQPMEASSACL